MPRLLLHTALALATGLLAGLVVIAFRIGVEALQALFLPGAEPGAYEALPAPLRALPLFASALLLGLAFDRLGPERTRVGIVHVIETLARGGARLPPVNAAVQFLGAVVAISGGHSVDREGPGVHLGAAVGSLLGRRAGLHYGSLRLLGAAGGAAAIAAAFDTPLAGVAFAIELFLRRITLESFVPVIVAAAAGATLSRTVFGPDPAFPLPPVAAVPDAALPVLALLGLALGATAVVFIRVTVAVQRRTAAWPARVRFLAAAAATAAIAWPVPEVMGISYDTVARLLEGLVAAGPLAAVFLAKLAATALAIGLGVPGGLIGPTLVIGGAAGGLVAVLTPWPADVTAFTLVGMGTMMGATLGAPLAAVSALLELTLSPVITLPLLVALVPAHLVVVLTLGQRSIFHALRAASRPI